MIIKNGTMQIVTMQGGGISSDGNPVPVVRTLSEEIEVNISGNRRRDNSTEHSAYTSATYEVLCDITDFDAEEISLKDRRGRDLGFFRVLDIQYLDCVDAVKITANRYGDD